MNGHDTAALQTPVAKTGTAKTPSPKDCALGDISAATIKAFIPPSGGIGSISSSDE